MFECPTSTESFRLCFMLCRGVLLEESVPEALRICRLRVEREGAGLDTASDLQRFKTNNKHKTSYNFIEQKEIKKHKTKDKSTNFTDLQCGP